MCLNPKNMKVLNERLHLTCAPTSAMLTPPSGHFGKRCGKILTYVYRWQTKSSFSHWLFPPLFISMINYSFFPIYKQLCSFIRESRGFVWGKFNARQECRKAVGESLRAVCDCLRHWTYLHLAALCLKATHRLEAWQRSNSWGLAFYEKIFLSPRIRFVFFT